MTEIFYAALPTYSASALREMLPDSLVAGSEKYTDPSAKIRSLGVRVLLKEALLQMGVAPSAVSLVISPEGKPSLVGAPLFLSLAHSEHYLAVALGNEAVGVDVEEETAVRHPHQLAKRFLDEATARQVREADNPHLAFAVAFTRLEATVKQKEGVTLPFAKDHLASLYYRTLLPLPEGKQAVLTAVGTPAFRSHKVDLA